MKKVILAAVVVFAVTAANAAWNQECFYGKCCKDGILDKQCVAASKGGKKVKKLVLAKQPVASAVRAEPKQAHAPAPAEPRLEVGRTLRIAGTHFDVNSHEINPRFERYLKAKSDELKGLKFTKVIIVGFTDNTGAADYNVWLSQQRAKAVADNFIKHGIPANKVEHSGRGAANPVADNKTKEGRAENRRVEITVK